MADHPDSKTRQEATVFKVTLSDIAERLAASDNPSTIMMTLSRSEVNDRHKILYYTPDDKILHLHSNEAAIDLANVIDHITLYRLQLELLLDEALAQRHDDPELDRILQTALPDGPLPTTMPESHDTQGGSAAGTLRHPVLGHMSNVELSTFYIRFLEKISATDCDGLYGFNAMMGKHHRLFLEHFDGYCDFHSLTVKADILIRNALRDRDKNPYHDDNYMQTAHTLGQKQDLGSLKKILRAYKNALQDQYDCAHDIALINSMQKYFPDLHPEWMKSDIFLLLQHQALKDYYAEHIPEDEKDILNDYPMLRRDIETDRTNRILQRLLSETLNTESVYSGAAQELQDMLAEIIRSLPDNF